MRFTRAISLIEVLVASLILVLVFAGILSAFVSSRTYVVRSNKRVVTTNIGRESLNSLYKDIRADTWNAGIGNIGLGTTQDLPSATIDNQVYNAGNIGVATTGTRDYRKVTVKTNYPED